MAEFEDITPDICVIGAGSGGLTVAAAAAAFGASVVLVEKGRMGGDCLNYGCVPSKALIAAAKHAHAIEAAADFGVRSSPPVIDFAAVNDHVRSVIAAIAPNDSVERFTALGVRVVQAHARFTGRNTVEAGGLRIKARRFVVATGSRAAVPPIPGLAEVGYLTNETLFEQRALPGHLVIIGGGPIGMEMAQAHRRLGAAVTVIEGAVALAKDDPELSAIVLDALRGEGVTLFERTSVERVEAAVDGGVRVTCRRDGEPLVVDGSHILVAAGRRPNIEDLGLDAAGIAHDKRGITVGSNLRSSNSRVYAIGDVAGGLQFTHVAGYHAGLVIQQILFRIPAKENRSIIPWVTFTDPELAHVGATEETARQKHRKIHVLRWPYAENDRAQAERRTTGMIKVIADAKGRILGASIVGAGAGEMINIWALALSKSMTLGDMRAYIPPYPTMSEIGKRAAITYYAPMTRKPIVRRIVSLLRRFG
jgi:pyruvate/2-oxoglutarate dehydrogenase complex dihydrolipoamide dehydrogenase (E3) component